MRALLALLAALALALNGVGLAAAAPMSAPGMHVDAAVDHEAGSEPCDCCDHGLPNGSDCQMKASCACPAGLAIAPAAVVVAIRLTVIHVLPSAIHAASEAPPPLRRPPRLLA